MSGYLRRYPVERILLDWHYTLPNRVTAIDLDLCEYCSKCSTPLALIELTMATGAPKATTVTRILAEKSGVRAYLVRWCRDDITYGVGNIWLQRIYPTEPEHAPLLMSLKEFGDWLTELHDRHQCGDTLWDTPWA